MDQDQLPAERFPLDALVQGLGILPQNLVSLALGGLVQTKLPTFIAKPCNKMFVKAFGINMAEAELPLGRYQTIQDVFTRRLQAGSRKVADGLASPADGRLVKSELVQAGRGVQAKGITYSLAELVYGQGVSSPADFKPAWFSTVYLAPHNYHRVHTPCEATAKCLRYIPGRLWPVNAPAVRAIPGLFCRNERLVFELEPAKGGKIWAVMVGALNVGRMTTPLQEGFVSNAAARQFKKTATIETKIDLNLAAGDEIGTFMLGSTVVLVLDQKATEVYAPKTLDSPRDIRMGQSLSH